MNEAVVFSQPLDLLVISGSGLKMGVVSQKIPARKKNPPFQNPRSAPAMAMTFDGQRSSKEECGEDRGQCAKEEVSSSFLGKLALHC